MWGGISQGAISNKQDFFVLRFIKVAILSSLDCFIETNQVTGEAVTFFSREVRILASLFNLSAPELFFLF